jgi:hypothetical protein
MGSTTSAPATQGASATVAPTPPSAIMGGRKKSRSHAKGRGRGHGRTRGRGHGRTRGRSHRSH